MTEVRSHSTPNSMTFPCHSICHFFRFYLLFVEEHDMDFGKVQVMEFPWHLLRKWWDFHRTWCHFRTNQTAVKTTWENIKCHIFYRVVSFIVWLVLCLCWGCEGFILWRNSKYVFVYGYDVSNVWVDPDVFLGEVGEANKASL